MHPEDPFIAVSIASAVMVGSILFILFRFRGGWRQTVGLPLGFVASFAMTNVGILVYLLPWYDPAEDAYLEQTGYTIEVIARGGWTTGIAFLGFLLGTCLIRRLPFPDDSITVRPPGYSTANSILVFGILFFCGLPFLRFIPSITPITFSAQFFMVCGICMGFIEASCRNDLRMQALYGLVAIVIPMITVTAFGFLDAGASMLILIVCFVFCRGDLLHRKSFLRTLPIAPIVIWIGLSVFVTYFLARNEIRKTVWSQNSAEAKINAVIGVLSNFQWFDIRNKSHLYSLDGRLNQNVLVGNAVRTHESFQIPYENGKTILNSAVAWVPRVLWPDKPAAGGSEFVAKHTGRRFAGGTTVGSGPIFEFYVNFGNWGVFIGFIIFGVFIRWLDVRATGYLLAGNHAKFMQFHVLGLVAINPMALLFFWVASMVGALIVTTALGKWLDRPRTL